MQEKSLRNKFLADDNIPRSAVKKLRSLGIDIVRVSEYGKGLSDEEIAMIAGAEGRIIIPLIQTSGRS